MSYRISRNIPCLYNYMDAVAHEQEVVPIRGRIPECKPIGPRRAIYMNIRKEVQEGQSVVICRLYNTDVVKYYEDGRITINFNNWMTPTTADFASFVLGVPVGIRHCRAWIKAAPKGYNQVGWYSLDCGNTENVFRRNGQGDLEMLNPPPIVTHRINRAEANNVRRQLKPFKEYLTRMMKIRDEGFSHQEFGDVFGWIKPDLPDYPKQLKVASNWRCTPEEAQALLDLARSKVIEDNYKAMLWLVRSSTAMWRGRWEPSKTSMLKLLDDLMLYANRDTVFITEIAPMGDVVRDSYGRFFG